MSGTETNGKRLRSFDFLRGLAVLSVVAFHCAVFSPSGVPVADALFGNGKLGVQLFFLISALTMCHMWEQRKDESHRAAKFYIRRFMRIAPLFWLAIALYIGVNGMQPSIWAKDGIAAHDIGLTAVFLHGFWPTAINNVVPGGWSIAVEMTFYALFPLIICQFGERRWAYLIAAMVLIAGYEFALRDWMAATLASSGFSPDTAGDFLFFNFINQCPIFLIGCYLHFALRHGIAKSEMLAIGAFAAFAWTFDQPFPLICIGLSAFVFLLLRSGAQSTLIEKFGQNSFAIYLLHFIIIQGAAFVLPGEPGLANLLVRFLAVAAICYGLSRLVHLTVERPVASVTKRIVGSVDRGEAGTKPVAA